MTIRPPGWDVSERGDNGLPHVVRPPQQANAMRYQVAGGKIFSGLTRVRPVHTHSTCPQPAAATAATGTLHSARCTSQTVVLHCRPGGVGARRCRGRARWAGGCRGHIAVPPLQNCGRKHRTERQFLAHPARR